MSKGKNKKMESGNKRKKINKTQLLKFLKKIKEEEGKQKEMKKERN